MGACPNGAEVIPSSTGLLEWLDRNELPLEIATLIKRLSPLGWVSIVNELVSAEPICQLNPDPPEPFTFNDFFAQSVSLEHPGEVAFPAVIRKAHDWLVYQFFLGNCQCVVPPPTPGANCVSWTAPLTIGSLGSILGPFPVSIDQFIMDGIFTAPNGDWTWFRSGSALVDGGAHNGNDLDIQYQATNGTWVTVDDIQTLNTLGTFCNSRGMLAATPRFGSSTSIRIVNNAGGTHTIANFSYCFCRTSAQPPPLPVQPPLDTIPTAPVLSCGTEDLCAMITELNHRLTNVSAQVSDIQAVVTTRDVLEELSRQTISGEGESSLVLGTRAVSVELTSLGPEAFTSALGRPRGLMRVGSIRYGDGIGYSPRRFIDADRYDDQLPFGALTVSWQLLQGTNGILKFLG